MADLELVEKLRERAHVTYDEAKEALDACDDDLLDAVIYLERKGKVPPPSGNGTYSSRQTESTQQEFTSYTTYKKPKSDDGSFSDLMRRFADWIAGLLRKGRDNLFVVRRHGKVIVSLPVLVVILLIIFCFWPSVIALVTGLFFSCRYSVKDQKSDEFNEWEEESTPRNRQESDSNSKNLNTIMDEVAEATESLKNEFMANHFKDKEKE